MRNGILKASVTCLCLSVVADVYLHAGGEGPQNQ